MWSFFPKAGCIAVEPAGCAEAFSCASSCEERSPRKSRRIRARFIVEFNGCSLARGEAVQKVLKPVCCRGKGTTTYRQWYEILTILCVFLLTGFSHPLILQLQIRGT